jgi:hypothetical protein
MKRTRSKLSRRHLGQSLRHFSQQQQVWPKHREHPWRDNKKILHLLSLRINSLMPTLLVLNVRIQFLRSL